MQTVDRGLMMFFAADLPDVSMSSVSRGGNGRATLHGVVFDILVGRGPDPPSPCGLRRDGLRSLRACGTAQTKLASREGWWARQDSNVQPDRYERRDIDLLHFCLLSIAFVAF
ncbi:hypothetical protein [Bradyrhizobium cenepequi]|uniref:hypothetical protein n=1 Tax=Bradyrhizobium cenepequi TaxID=2821403 RepID=UPI001CE3AB22|nr:hypothetical protein [Bradyrhizobium cenepequi]MCA6110920.1 hypothetical protein [Bradyrhizobium cenepequi]